MPRSVMRVLSWMRVFDLDWLDEMREISHEIRQHHK